MLHSMDSSFSCAPQYRYYISDLRGLQKVYYSLQQQKVKNVKCITTTTELVVLRSLCSVCKSVTKSKVVFGHVLD